MDDAEGLCRFRSKSPVAGCKGNPDWSSQQCTDRNHGASTEKEMASDQWPNAAKRSNRMKAEERPLEGAAGASERKLCER